MVETRYPKIERALEIVDREREYTDAEREALEEFLGRLSSIEPATPGDGAVNAPTDPVSVSATAAGRSKLDAVTKAYRETVLAVDHFEEVYDESLVENAAAEFGQAIAIQLVDGQQLIPVLYDALQEATRSSIHDRKRFLDLLGRERESLREIERRLGDCEATATQLAEEAADDSGPTTAHLEERFGELEAECRGLSESRQRLLHGRSVADLSGVDGASLSQFLYAELDTDCPALAEITACLETIQALERRTTR